MAGGAQQGDGRARDQQRARQHDVEQRGDGDQMNPRGSRRATGGALPAQRFERLVRCRQGDARDERRRTVQHVEQHACGAGTEEGAVPAGVVTQHDAADVESRDQPERHERGAAVDEPLGLEHEQRARDRRPLAREALQRGRQRHVEARRPPQERRDATAQPALVQIRERRVRRQHAAVRSQPRHGEHRVDEHVPGDQTEQRKRDDVDALAAVERGQRRARGEREHQQRRRQPGDAARQREHVGDRRRARPELVEQQLGAPHQHALRITRERPAGRGLLVRALALHGAARCFRAIGERQHLSGVVALVDRADQQHHPERAFVHRALTVEQKRGFSTQSRAVLHG
jgi:hypothetical protein